MRGGWLGPAVVLAVALATALAGCTATVPGSGTAAPTTRLPVPRTGLDVDVLPDECLLTASELGALVGTPVEPPRQGAVRRGDGSSSSSCAAASGAEPVAMINVYATRSGTPADHLRGVSATGGRRDLAGVGEAAAVVEAQWGPTLQLASPRYLVTILVAGRTPSDDAWRTAATAALARLPA